MFVNVQMNTLWCASWCLIFELVGDGKKEMAVEKEVFWEKPWWDWKFWINILPLWKILGWPGWCLTFPTTFFLLIPLFALGLWFAWVCLVRNPLTGNSLKHPLLCLFHYVRIVAFGSFCWANLLMEVAYSGEFKSLTISSVKPCFS